MAPLIFFVHVPKTAGSTVNSYLHEYLPNGRSHCEAFLNNKDEIEAAASSCDWLSGHVDLSTAESVLSRSTNRPVRYFTCIREPTMHVRSHYNWIIEIFHRGGQFYENHPARIKEISDLIRFGPSNAATISSNLNFYSGLFLNTQSRVILGHDFNWNTGLIYQRLKRYEMIVDSSNVQALVSNLLGTKIEKDRTENSSNYHFDPSVFDGDELREFLKVRNTLDELLYEIITKSTNIYSDPKAAKYQALPS